MKIDHVKLFVSAQILVAGTAEQVNKAMETAESLKDELLDRGVLVVPLPVFEGQSDAAQPQLAGLSPQDLK